MKRRALVLMVIFGLGAFLGATGAADAATPTASPTPTLSPSPTSTFTNDQSMVATEVAMLTAEAGKPPATPPSDHAPSCDGFDALTNLGACQEYHFRHQA